MHINLYDMCVCECARKRVWVCKYICMYICMYTYCISPVCMLV